MLKLLGSALIASGGVLAWYTQRAERRRRREALWDMQRALRRRGEEVRLTRTPLPFFTAVSRAAGAGEDLPEVWRREAGALPLAERDRAAVSALGGELQGDEEQVRSAVSQAAWALAKSGEETERRRAEEEKRAAALWFSTAALLVILLV